MESGESPPRPAEDESHLSLSLSDVLADDTLPSPPVVSRPGAHWDGVDRSNGFERDYFREMNKKKERDRMAFMWSQEDM